MTLSIKYTDTDKRAVTDSHDQRVAARLGEAIEQKNETLQWKQRPEQCFSRFHNMIVISDCYFPEIWFSSHEREYRAILCWADSVELFKLVTVVEKEEVYDNSRQHQVLDNIYKDPRGVIQQVS